MIQKESIYELISELLDENKDVFVVSLEVSSNNKISLLIDRLSGLKVDDCVKFSRAIEFGLDREKEDFELEVSSPGLGSPFKVRQQYEKNIDRDVEVILKDGTTLKGKLAEVNDSDFSLDAKVRIKAEAKSKKKKFNIERKVLAYDDVSITRVVLKF